MVLGRFAVVLAALTVAAPAWADGDDVEMPVPVRVDGEHVAAASAAQPAAQPARPSGKRCVGSCSYKALLGSLVITRDLEIPSAPDMSVRLLPTSHAIGGKSSPIVLRPRVPGGGGWYGVDIAARF